MGFKLYISPNMEKRNYNKYINMKKILLYYLHTFWIYVILKIAINTAIAK